MEKKTIIKIIIFSIVVALILGLFISFFIDASPTSKWLLSALEYLEKIHIVWGSILLVVFYTVALLFILPGTPFNLAAGFLFGIWIGSLVTVIGCFLGGFFGFILGRYIIRSWAEKMMEQKPKFKAIDRAITTKGFLIIFLTRLSPIMPYGLCNYLFGVTSIGFLSYNGSTLLGLLPGTIAYTYLGTLMKSLTDIYSDDEEVDVMNIIFIVVGVVLTILIIVIVTIVSKREIDKAINHEENLMEKKIDVESSEKQVNEGENNADIFVDFVYDEKKVDHHNNTHNDEYNETSNLLSK
eukprot:TRINITY_DN16152_c0_g1_i1.p1 TRINITY_DN16152_c0_g1~~TRINITY_DN16152_c0_g1_i1.p1  ORF type:complete len:296 (-),score=68.40 TRINITY_DN16152_c0_g1_i1:29-916(-)